MTIKKLSDIIKEVNKENAPPKGWPSDKEWVNSMGAHTKFICEPKEITNV